MESNFGGPIGILIAGLGLGAFYTALIWVNTLLGLFLTPLFMMPLAWVQDAMKARKAAAAPRPDETSRGRLERILAAVRARPPG